MIVRRRLLCLAVLLACFAMRVTAQNPPPPSCSTSEPNTTVYRVWLGGLPAGVFTLRQAGGVVRSCFEFNDRGRGPHQESALKANDRGIPVSLETSGNDYLKNPIEERFTVDGGTARWNNKAEHGEKSPAGDAAYVGISEDPITLVQLVEALRKAPGGKLPLLPAGEATLTRVGDQEVSAKGQSRTVSLYEIGGIDFSPTPVWLNRDGSFFSQGSSWMRILPEGWEAAEPQLQKREDEAEAARQKGLAQRFAHKPSGPLVIEHANLFDAEHARSVPRTTVVIRGNQIEALGPDGSVGIPADAQIIDASGKALFPGLWDMHVHLSDTDGILNIAAGVTTVRDMANKTDYLMALRRSFDEGSKIGPRVIMAGIIDGPGPYQGPTTSLADTPEQARKLVDRYADLGYEQIKIYSSVKPELVPAIIDEARKYHLRVSGHVPAFMTAQQAVEDGYNEVQHINFFFLNFLFDKVQDTRTPARFTAVGQYGASIDPRAPRVQKFITLLKQRHVDWDPTLVAFEGMYLGRPGTPNPSYAAVMDRLPPQVRRGFLTGGLPITPANEQLYHDAWLNMVRMVGELYHDGVPIVAGTDNLCGFALHRELELYVQAGIAPPQVLQLATLGAARVMHHEAESGSLAPGKLADMILVDGDPASHISDIRRTSLVIKDGVIFRPAELYPAIGVQP